VVGLKRATPTADNSGVVAVALPCAGPAWWDEVPTRRVGAALVDLILAGGTTALVAAAADTIAPVPAGGPAPALMAQSAVLAALVLAVPLAWFVVGEGRTGTTVGKHLVGLEVTDDAGGRPGWRRAAMRLTLRLSPLAWAAVLWAAWRGGEPWPDRWSGTRVVRRPDTVCEGHNPVRGRLVAPRRLAAGSRFGRRHRQEAARRRHPSAGERPLRLVPPLPPPLSSARPRPLAPPFERPGRRRRGEGADRPRPGAGPRRLTVVGAGDSPPAGGGSPAGPAVGGSGRGPAGGGSQGSPGAGGSGGEPARCRCHELPRLSGADAVTYACGHLLAVRRRPGAGWFSLVCPTTRVAWLAHDEWADRSGEATLVRLAALPDPVASPRPPDRP
jgi:hypothetical protein